MSPVKFAFGKPVTLRYLFDRENELNDLMGKRGSFVYGPLGIGKTSLIKSIPELAGLNSIYLNGESISSTKSLAKALKSALSAATKNLSNKKAFEGAIIEIENFMQGKSDALTFMKNFFNELSLSANSENFILLFDEFCKLRRIGPNFLYLSRELYRKVKEGHLKAVIASSEIGCSKEILDRKDLPLKLVFDPIYVKPFSYEISVDFLSKGLESYSVSCPKNNLTEAYYVSEGFPIWLSLIGMRMLEGKCDPKGIYHDPRAQSFWIKVLLNLSKKERLMLRYISKSLDFKEAGPHSRRTLKALIRRGLVIENEKLEIADPVLYYMLKNEIL